MDGINAVSYMGEDQRCRAWLFPAGYAVDSVVIASGHGVPDLQIIVPVGGANPVIHNGTDGDGNHMEYTEILAQMGAA